MTACSESVGFCVCETHSDSEPPRHRCACGREWETGQAGAIVSSPSPRVLTLPVDAVEDFAEYCRLGGRFDVEVWWERYKGDYEAVSL